MITVLWMVLVSVAAEPPVQPLPDGEIVSGLLAHEGELLQAVETNDPQHYQRLMVLRESDRGSYLAALYKVSKLVERARSDPAFAERLQQIQVREDQLRAMAAGFAARSAAEQGVLRAQMVALASELMDLKQAERRSRLEELRSRLDALQREIEQREKDRDAIVGEYVDRLVR